MKKPYTVKFRLAEIVDQKRGEGVQRDGLLKDIAKRSGLNYRTVLNIYHGKNVRVELETLGALAYALNVTPGDLISFEINRK